MTPEENDARMDQITREIHAWLRFMYEDCGKTREETWAVVMALFRNAAILIVTNTEDPAGVIERACAALKEDLPAMLKHAAKLKEKVKEERR